MFYSNDRSRKGLHMPLLKLQDALAALENNAVEPIIKPVPRKGRSVSSDARASLKGHVAGAVQRLCQAGLDQPEARRQVAKALVKLGIKPERGPATRRNHGSVIGAIP